MTGASLETKDRGGREVGGLRTLDCRKNRRGRRSLLGGAALDRRPAVFVVAAWFVLAASGCAYYNTFFLARKYFNQGVLEEKKSTTGKLSPSAASSYDKSIKQCQKILQRYGSSKWVDDALLLMGRAHFGREEYGEARRRFEELLNRYPKSPLASDSRFWIARTHLALKEFEEAVAGFEDILANHPSFRQPDEAHYFMAETEYRQERYGAAAEKYQTLVNRYPRSPRVAEALLRIGDARFQDRKFDEAKSAYELVAARTTEPRVRLDAMLKIGQSLEKLQRQHEALKVYESVAFEIVPGDGLERILSATDASANFAANVSPNRPPNFPDPNDPGGIAYDDQGNEISPGRGAVNPDPTFDPSRINDPNRFGSANDPRVTNPLNTAGAAAAQGAPRDPNAASRQAIAAAQTNNPLAVELPRVLLRQGQCLAELGKTKEAINLFRSIIAAYQRTSEAGEAQYRIGYIQEVHLEDYAAAKVSYDAVKSHGATVFVEQANRRSAALARLTALAAAEVQGAAPGVDAEAEKDFLAAELFLFQQEKPEKALEQYTLVEDKYPKSPFAAKAALARAWILVNALRDSAGARAAYQRVLETYPKTEEYRVAHEVLIGPLPEEELLALAKESASAAGAGDNARIERGAEGDEAIRESRAAGGGDHARGVGPSAPALDRAGQQVPLPVPGDSEPGSLAQALQRFRTSTSDSTGGEAAGSQGSKAPGFTGGQARKSPGEGAPDTLGVQPSDSTSAKTLAAKSSAPAQTISTPPVKRPSRRAPASAKGLPRPVSRELSAASSSRSGGSSAGSSSKVAPSDSTKGSRTADKSGQGGGSAP